ncbi:MAG: Band 7 protein, partial [Phycisphaerales bacterium]|nr:Band 7 protein [Phycisphaerales bacterium]
MSKRIVLFCFLCVPALVLYAGWQYAVQPDVGAKLSVAAVNGGNQAATELRAYTAASAGPEIALAAYIIIAFSLCLGGTTRRAITWRRRPVAGVAAAAIAMVAISGCSKYDTPEFVEVDTSQSAFVVPLEGDTANQATFQSEKYLADHKVATKRIQIAHRWNQTGRMYGDGDWLPTVRVIKVDRSPVTREWNADTNSGTASKNQAIWVESADSVGFSMGFSATAYIKEEDAAKFLYWYPTGSLDKVMDGEIRARVQRNVSEVAAKYPLDTLRARKQEMVDAARNDIVQFFNERGITLTTLAAFGGMTYENPELQKSIDQVFIAQQQKAVNLAAFDAQQKANERMTLEAEATAEKARKIAKGEADSKVIAA